LIDTCRIHHGQITANQVLLPVLEDLQPVAEARASHLMVCISLWLLASAESNNLSNLQYSILSTVLFYFRDALQLL